LKKKFVVGNAEEKSPREFPNKMACALSVGGKSKFHIDKEFFI